MCQIALSKNIKRVKKKITHKIFFYHKNFLVTKVFWLQQNVSYKKILVTKMFKSQKNLVTKKFSHKKVLVTKKF